MRHQNATTNNFTQDVRNSIEIHIQTLFKINNIAVEKNDAKYEKRTEITRNSLQMQVL